MGRAHCLLRNIHREPDLCTSDQQDLLMELEFKSLVYYNLYACQREVQLRNTLDKRASYICVSHTRGVACVFRARKSELEQEEEESTKIPLTRVSRVCIT